jgi:Fe-S cluster biosynthesis and repair protein YggX
MLFWGVNTIVCRRHPGDSAPALARAPFRSELGERILREICADCWRDWLQHQTLLINHYGLDPRKAESRDFLYGQVRAVLFGEGQPAEIDTSKRGTIAAPDG